MKLSSARHNSLDRLAQLAMAEPLDPGCGHFYFLRHGETEFNAQRIFQPPEQPLNTNGLREAHEAAAVLCAHAITMIHASDMPRAAQTARIAAERIGLPVRPHAGLRERNFGALVGSSSAVVDWAVIPERGETLEQFVARTRMALAETLASGPGTLIVAHGGTLLVLAAAIGAEVPPTQRGNAMPLRFERHATGWAVEALQPHRIGSDNLA